MEKTKVENIRQIISDLSSSQWWNYIMIASAVLTIAIAMRNITQYTKQIKIVSGEE